jgi:hypothetical protein
MSNQIAPSLSSLETGRATSSVFTYQTVCKDVNCRLLNFAWLALLDRTLRCDYAPLFSFEVLYNTMAQGVWSNKGVMAVLTMQVGWAFPPILPPIPPADSDYPIPLYPVLCWQDKRFCSNLPFVPCQRTGTAVHASGKSSLERTRI